MLVVGYCEKNLHSSQLIKAGLIVSNLMLQKNIESLLEKLRKYEQRYRRKEFSVNLLAVSKRQSIHCIQNAFENGLTHFGENYASEAIEKMDGLRDYPITWHFIGPIQANKTRLLAENFDWIQSVDREKIAHRLNDQRPIEKKPLNICVQVKISDEPNKAGISMSQLHPLCVLVDSLPRLRLRGLMAIPAPKTGLRAQQSVYKPLKETFNQLKSEFLTLDTLSIGMSADFEAAIAQNSNLVRIGTSLFGKRSESA